MHPTRNSISTTSSILGIIGLAVTAIFLMQRSHLALAIIGAGLILAGLAAAAFVALRNRSRGLATMDGMTTPASLVFAGCAVTILCDIDTAVLSLR